MSEYPVCRNVACGRRHNPRWNCNDLRALVLPREGVVTPTVANAVVTEPRMANVDVANRSMANAAPPAVEPLIDSCRCCTSTYRYRDAQGRRAYQRIYMQTRRAITAGRAGVWPRPHR